MAELWVKFYFRPNEDYSPGDSISDNSEKLLQRHRGKVSVHMVLVKGGACYQALFFFAGVSVSSSVGKESACNAGDLGSIPGLGRSPGKGNVYPLQYSGLENSMTEEPGRLQSMASQRVSHDQVTFTFTLWKTFIKRFALMNVCCSKTYAEK